MSTVDVDMVGRTMAALLRLDGRAVVYHGRAVDRDLIVSPEAAASPIGLLPALLVAGEAVWRETTGKGFALDIVRDPDAVLGFRLRGIGAGSFTTVMLATLEATHQVAGPSAILLSDLNALWVASIERFERCASPGAVQSTGAAP
jgi:hypothetical protein